MATPPQRSSHAIVLSMPVMKQTSPPSTTDYLPLPDTFPSITFQVSMET